MQALRAGRGIALAILDPGATKWCVVNATPRSPYAQERDTVPIIQEASRVSGPVSMSPDNLAHSEVRTSDRPTCSESLSLLLMLEICMYTYIYICRLIRAIKRSGSFQCLYISVH